MRKHWISTSTSPRRWRLSSENAGTLKVTASRTTRVISTLIQLGIFSTAISTLLMAASPVRALPFGQYKFTIFQTTGIDGGVDGGVAFFREPTINDSGRIAVVVGLDDGRDQVRMYSAPITTSAPTIIAEGGVGVPIPFGDKVSINNSGTVIFQGISPSGSSSLLASSGGLITTVVDESGSFFVDGLAITDIGFFPQWDSSDSGEVTFKATLESGNTGIFGRNVAGGGVFRRTTDAHFSDFVFDSPAVNARGDFAVLLSFNDEGIEYTRQQIISNFGTFMDTNNEFAVQTVFGFTQQIDMNNAGIVMFEAKLDSGIRGIFTSNNGDTPSMFVDTSGPFEDFIRPSINTTNGIAFFATLDAGGGKGIFRGPNPITDKIIAVGDVIGTRGGVIRTVVDVGLFDNDGFSKNGQIAFTVRDQIGTEYLMKGGPGLVIDLDSTLFSVQLTTATDEKRGMMQEFDLPSLNPTQLQFDYRQMTLGSAIVAYINDVEIGRIARRGTMSEFAPASIPIDWISLFGDVGFPEDFVLKLEVVGGPGNTFQLDNIRFANFDLVNGDFSTGDLTGWQFDGGAGAAMVTTGMDLVFVDELTLPGDFNFDNSVDAADYVLWRKTDGTQTGYNTWRAFFGATQDSGLGSGGSASGSAVPEPATLLVLIAGISAICSCRRKR